MSKGSKTMFKPHAWMTVALVMAIGLSGCGQDGNLDTLSLSLEFGPNTMPDNTNRLLVSLLPSLVEISPGEEEAINCDLFVGPTADKTVYDYTKFLVKGQENIPFDPTQRSAVELKELPDMLLVFLIDALDEPGNTLAVGCGKGQIERGKKTFIPIYMELR